MISSMDSPILKKSNSLCIEMQISNESFLDALCLIERKRTKSFLTLTEVENEILKLNDDCSKNNTNQAQKYDLFSESSSNNDRKMSDGTKSEGSDGFLRGDSENKCSKVTVMKTPNDFLLSNPRNNDINKDNKFIKNIRLCRSATNSSCCASDSDNSSPDSDKCCSSPYRQKVKKHKRLPPIGVFWDIENCQVPKGRNAVAVVQQIRDTFFSGYREAEFVVVCDVKKENSQVLHELNDAQVNLIHIASTCKNAADEKLRQSMRRFADTHKFPCTIILISSDINFASDLSDLRHRKRIHIILLHNTNVSEALILCANEHYQFSSITDLAPMREVKTLTPVQQQVEVVVSNLPVGYDHMRIRNRLKKLSDNCGGRVAYVSIETGEAVLRFASQDIGIRAQKRMDGEDVYGQKISVSYPRPLTWDKPHSPVKNLSGSVTLCGILPLSVPPLTIPPNPQETWFQNSNNETHIRNTFYPELCGQMKEQYQLIQENTTLQTVKNLSESGRYIRGRHSYQLYSEKVSDNWNSYNSNNRSAPYPGRPITKMTVEQSQIHNNSALKRSRTPNTFHTSLAQQIEKNNGSNARNDKHENTFRPIQNVNKDCVVDSVTNNVSVVDLSIMNLDNSIHPKEMRNILLNLLVNEHVKVLQLSIHTQSDGNMVALLKVESVQDAQYVISMLHRRRIGQKRIIISYMNSGSPNLNQLRAQVIALLQDVPTKKMPLFVFCELFETRYHTSVSISDLYKLRDTCTVNEDATGRMISLCGDLISNTPSPILSQQEAHNVDQNYCQKHISSAIARGWAELDVPELPNIRIGLKLFTARLHSLLHSHNGTLHLQSLPTCYEHEMKESMPIDETGVPLEHLVTCVSSVELCQGPVKLIVWASDSAGNENINDDSSTASGPCTGKSTPIATQLALFSRELIELLRTVPHCRLLFTKFIPAYHHHFGRQCRVADYGFTKLIDLFESLSHVVQIIGDGNKRMLTLCHRAQISRFTNDLLRTLKASISRQVLVNDFPSAAERVLGRSWDPTDYGVCELNDLLIAVPEHTVVITGTGENTIISLPKREQTPEEIVKTKQFAIEVVELLKHAPQCSILFNKFVPAYHHHFGHQCRVSDYGFTKLIELFEAIPEVVKIEDALNGERMIHLTKEESLKVLSSQIISLIISSKNPSKIPLSYIESAYIKEHGYALQPESYGFSSIEDIMKSLENIVMLTMGPNNTLMVELIDQSILHSLGLRIWRLMLNVPGYKIATSFLLQAYHSTYNDYCEFRMLKKLCAVVQVVNINSDETITELTAVYTFAAQSYAVLYDVPCGLTSLSTFEHLFFRKHGIPVRPAAIGYPTLEALVSDLPDILLLIGHNQKQIMLNRKLAGVGVPLPYSNISYPGDSNTKSNKSVKTKRLNNGVSNKSKNTSCKRNTSNFTDANTQSSLWPLQQNVIPSYIPPKPDTPPTQGTALWNELLWTPPDYKRNINLSIQLPNAETPKLPDSPCFISPDKNLLSACLNSQDRCPLQPPPANTLPMPSPEYFENRSSKDSTCTPKSIDTNSFSDMNNGLVFQPCTPVKCKRKVRLAAQFNSPINIS